MEKSITWLIILFKMQIRNVSTWIMLVVIGMLLMIMKDISVPFENTNTVILCDMERSDSSKGLIDDLVCDKSLFDFQELNDRALWEKKIRTGEVLCGFMIPEGFTDHLLSQNQDEIIIYECLSDNAKCKIAKEKVYEKLFTIYSDYILEAHAKEICDDSGFVDDVKERKEEYLSSNELFYVETGFLSDSGEKGKDSHLINVAEADSKTYPLYGTIAVLMLTSVMLVPCENMDRGRSMFLQALQSGEKLHFNIMQYIAAGLIIEIPAVIYIGITEGFFDAMRQMVMLNVFLIFCVFSVLIFQLLIKSKQSCYGWFMVLILCNILTAPILYDFSVYFPMLKIIRKLFPVGLYIDLLNVYIMPVI